MTLETTVKYIYPIAFGLDFQPLTWLSIYYFTYGFDFTTLTVAGSVLICHFPDCDDGFSGRGILPLRFIYIYSISHLSTHRTPLVDAETERSIYQDFLGKMEYHKPELSDADQSLEDALRSEMHTRKMQCPQLERTVHLAARLVEVCTFTIVSIYNFTDESLQLAYPNCTFEQKKIIALINW